MRLGNPISKSQILIEIIHEVAINRLTFLCKFSKEQFTIHIKNFNITFFLNSVIHVHFKKIKAARPAYVLSKFVICNNGIGIFC